MSEPGGASEPRASLRRSDPTAGDTGGLERLIDPAAGAGGPARHEVRRLDVLRWVYLARVGLAGGLFAAAVLAWTYALPAQTLAASLALVITLIFTPLSYWHTHVGQTRPPAAGFLYAQAALDVLLVTLVVHLTGGRESIVAPLYILLISVYTLMLPLRGGLLVTAMASSAYIADVVWLALAQGVGGSGLWGQTAVDTVVVLQLAIFLLVALVVGLIGTKLRETGAELSSVERALEQLRLETGDILGNIPTAVLTVDGHGRLAYANPAAEELLGIDASVWLDREVLEELGQRSPDLQRALERACRHGLPVASAEVPVRRDGEMVPVGISTALLERGEGPPSVTAIMRDISDRKRVERLRQRAERLEAVAELSAALAHEIKNPLASISSSVQQLRLREVADDDDRLLSGLILKESDRLSRLLSDFIDFARVQIERTRELDLRRVVKDAVAVVRQHPSYREEIEIAVQLDDEPVLFHGDEDLMHRVVTNLVLNAVQAAVPGRGGRVSVEARGDDFGPTPQGVDLIDPVVLSVDDDGPGIPEGDLERIFDPFFSKRRGGTGLGLAIVHRAVREHNGLVVVTSSARAGTRFAVYLPRVMATRDKAKET